MKKTIRLMLLTVIVSILAFVACQKDTNSKLPESVESPENGQEFRPNNDILSELVLDPKDKVVEFINRKKLWKKTTVHQLKLLAH